MLTNWQWAILIIFMMIAANYVIYLAYNIIYGVSPRSRTVTEGFEDQSEQSRYAWLTAEDVYDDFYANIYDKLVQGEKRSQAEVITLLSLWKNVAQPSSWKVLDIGCGTGITTASFAKASVGSIVGLDRSPAMLRRARDITVSATTLTPEQRGAIVWKHGDVENLALFREGEFTHACAMYFAFYYIKDKAVFFRNLHHWVRPGGILSIATVNKHKFDPLLESASPTVFSMQKYVKERITKSKVAFDKFDYEANFDLLDGDKAEFKETFRYKDGTIRRQKHDLWMPDMKDIVHIAESAGWKYSGFTDGSRTTGFDYAYILTFVRN
jgi:ubiquinone/menaquinone biosynthesis C-methylase UbiE